MQMSLSIGLKTSHRLPTNDTNVLRGTHWEKQTQKLESLMHGFRHVHWHWRSPVGEGQAERGTHLKRGGLKNSTKDRAREMLKTPTEGVV